MTDKDQEDKFDDDDFGLPGGDDDFGLPDEGEEEITDSEEQTQAYDQTDDDDAGTYREEEYETEQTETYASSFDSDAEPDDEFVGDSTTYQSTTSVYTAPEEKRGGGAKIVLWIIGIVIVLGLGVGAWYLFVKAPSDKKAKLEQFVLSGNEAYEAGDLEKAIQNYKEALKLAPNNSKLAERLEEAESKLEAEQLAAEQAEAEAAARADSVAQANAAAADSGPELSPDQGEISTISSRTGRYHVIIGSFFDGDLANDFAKKLAKDGISTTIIAPYGKVRFYRVSLAQSESLQQATAKAEEVKATFGSGVWVIRY